MMNPTATGDTMSHIDLNELRADLDTLRWHCAGEKSASINHTYYGSWDRPDIVRRYYHEALDSGALVYKAGQHQRPKTVIAWLHAVAGDDCPELARWTQDLVCRMLSPAFRRGNIKIWHAGWNERSRFYVSVNRRVRFVIWDNYTVTEIPQDEAEAQYQTLRAHRRKAHREYLRVRNVAIDFAHENGAKCAGDFVRGGWVYQDGQEGGTISHPYYPGVNVSLRGVLEGAWGRAEWHRTVNGRKRTHVLYAP
jgi:hypothetical protein